MSKKKTTKRPISEKTNRFRRMFNVFENNISLHEVSINIMGTYALKYDESVMKELNEKINARLKNKKKGTKLSSKEKDALLKSIFEARKKHPKQSELFAKNTYVSIVSTLDYLFTEIFQYYYSTNPDKLSIQNKSISFNELKNIENIQDAQKFLINREVDLLLLQNGLNDRLKILNDDFGVSLSEETEYVKSLRKIIKIRNLIVHNEGRADAEYVSLYDENNLKKTEKINLTEKSLSEALYVVYFAGGFILQKLQKKFSTESVKSEEFILNDVIHRLVKNDKFDFIRQLYDYAIQLGNLDERNRKMVIINYCIALKKQGKDKNHIEKVLEKEDWSCTSDDFQMTLAALQEKDEEFYGFLRQLIETKTLTDEELEEWEIFSFYQKKQKFKSIIKLSSLLLTQ